MTDHLRAVFDTNIFISAFPSRNPRSPAQELLGRWQEGEFVLIFCEALLDEILDKMNDRQINHREVQKFIALTERLAEMIVISMEDAPITIPADLDDDIIVACAIEAKVNFWVTHDKHFDVLGGEYQGVKIVKALPFLWAVRGDQPPQD